MNLHEYQAKRLFKRYGLPVSEGILIERIEHVDELIKQEEGQKWVVKVQVHAGGRGSAGGVAVVETIEEIKAFVQKWLNQRLITKQTVGEGQLVSTCYVEPCVDIESEFYLSLLVDRSTSSVVCVASAEGGVDIEKVSAVHPEKIVTIGIDPFVKVQSYQAQELGQKLGLSSKKLQVQLAKILQSAYQFFVENDCSLLEINPLVLTKAQELHCLDAKVSIDDNALYRHSNLQRLEDTTQEDQREADAKKYGLNYVALDGNIGCMVNGAGLAMGTMDLVKLYGGEPANFLDVGGGATREAVSEAFRLILSDEKVKAVLINIFGGIVSCLTIAEGILGAIKTVGVNVPVVVRFEGNNAEKGMALLDESDLAVSGVHSLADAAKQVVLAVREDVA